MHTLYTVSGILTLLVTAAPLFYKRKERRKMWTHNNDGINLPENMDASEHSGAVEPEIKKCIHDTIEADCKVCNCAHDGGFTDGLLPGNRAIKHCKLCGKWFDKLAEAVGEAIGEQHFNTQN